MVLVLDAPLLVLVLTTHDSPANSRFGASSGASSPTYLASTHRFTPAVHRATPCLHWAGGKNRRVEPDVPLRERRRERDAAVELGRFDETPRTRRAREVADGRAVRLARDRAVVLAARGVVPRDPDPHLEMTVSRKDRVLLPTKSHCNCRTSCRCPTPRVHSVSPKDRGLFTTKRVTVTSSPTRSQSHRRRVLRARDGADVRDGPREAAVDPHSRADRRVPGIIHHEE